MSDARRLTGWSRHLARALSAVLLGSMLTVPMAVGAAAGERPPTPRTEFTAPLCAGSTDSDPKAASAVDHHGETDLTRVFGARLASYNRGDVVPLYDSYGWAQAAYPPLCGTYHDAETGAPHSVWMFCTDVRKKVCGDIGPGGTLAEGATVEGPLGDLPANPRLTSKQERIIAWLLEHGHSYIASPGEPAGTVADQTSSATRFALQNLIWCVSDPDLVDVTFQAMCAANLPRAEKQRILALTPESAQVSLKPTRNGRMLVGQRKTLEVTTNVFNQPIVLATSGAAEVSMRVCSGPGTLTGNRLVVRGSNPLRKVTVRLCLQARTHGTFRLRAEAKAVSAEKLQWARSTSLCQVFARFRHDVRNVVSARGRVQVVRTRPKVSTRASQPTATPGTRLHAQVAIRHLRTGFGARARATLYGPLPSPSARSCTPADAVRTLRLEPRNGTLRTGSVRVTEPGWYVWVANTTEDRANLSATHRCGLRVASTLVSKKAYTVTTVDTGFSGAVDSRRSGDHGRLTTTGVQAGWVATGRVGTSMAIPGDVRTVGWLHESAAPGDAIGTTVMAGHVSDRSDRPGALYALQRARVGQEVRVVADGRTLTYRVTSVERLDRNRPLPARLFSTTGRHRVVLISCAGKVVREGRWHYTQNVVVTGVPVRR